MRDDYSIVIVGAGPAGSNLARRIAQKKYRVLLIDGTMQKGDKVCAGLLSPDAQDLLAEYGISLPGQILTSPQLFSVRTLDLARREVRHYRRSYVNVDRGKFDRFLLEMVPDEVDILQGVCKKIQRRKDGFLLEVKSKEGCKKIQCDYLVGADGANSIVRKCFFPECEIERYVAIQQWFQAGRENPYYSCIFDNDTSPSCSWIFFKDGKMVFGGAFSPFHCREAFELQKKKLVARGIVSAHTFQEPIKTEACMVSRPHPFYGVCRGKDRVFLIGEAAGFISPSSLEGISYALSSSEALAQAFAKNAEEKTILHGYRKKTRMLCLKIACKCFKRPFMYHSILRACILKSGIGAIRMKFQEVRNESEKFV